MIETLLPASPKEAAALGATSLTKFGKLFFPRTFRQESPPFHEVMGRALLGPSRFNAFEVFRGGAKTSLLRAYTAQRMSYAISRTIMYVGASQPHAIFSLRWLRRQVEYNKRWANTFGLTPGLKWTDEWMEVKHNLSLDEHQPDMPVIITVLAAGITGQIRGYNPDDFRPDLIVLDDPLNDENSATDDQRAKIENLIFGALLKSMAPASEAPLAKAAFLQTPMDKKDPIEKCMRDPEWNPVKFGILEYPPNEAPRSRWEVRFPTEVVIQEKEAHVRRSQYRLWMREMECELVSGEEKAIDIEQIKFFEVLPETFDMVLISVDPASSEKLTADEFATVALGFKGQDVFLLDYAARQNVMPDAAANDFFYLTLLYHPFKGVVESNAYQRIMAWYLEQEMHRRRIYVAIDRLEVRTKNSDRIMQTIPGLVAYGHFHCRPSHTKFLQQADDYAPAVKDIPDDILTAIANGIISYNPALRSHMVEDETTGLMILDESQYKPIRVRASP